VAVVLVVVVLELLLLLLLLLLPVGGMGSVAFNAASISSKSSSG
jgi:hypothetical protein